MKKLEVNKQLLQKVAKAGTAFVLAGSLLLSSNVISIEHIYSDTVHATTIDNMETVNLNVQMGVNLYMDDKGFIPTDVNGNETYPFISDGTTYVPVRAIAELFHADIKWDEKTKSVHINTSGDTADLVHTKREKKELYNVSVTAVKGAKLYVNGVEYVPTDVNGQVKDIYIINGTTYVPVRAVSNALGLPIEWSGITNSVFIGKHKNYGLTVENINNIEELDKCGKEFFHVGEGQLDYGYKYDGNVYYLNSERIYNKYYPPTFALMFANYEYCNQETFKKMFEGIDEYTFERFVGFFNFISLLPKGDNYFKWKEYMINEEYGIRLDEFQTKYIQAKKSQNYDEIIALILNYFDGTDEFRYKNTTPLIDYIITYTSMLVRQQSGTNLYDSNYVYNHVVGSREGLTKQVEEVRNTVLSNSLTK